MSNELQLGFALGFPVVLLVMILWLAHLEDSLPARVRAARRKPDPEPILAIKVRARPAAVAPAAVQPVAEVPARPAVAIPAQRQPERLPAPQEGVA